ncbi:hypothetical protein DFH08DRAFT_895888 [Mycena albidolilacea]|uniref:Uncharacterized protein n=1 Tax=Mycena albidolilacea TaxID=1033008 RepID=A0AAD6ZA96_9AGAR|nr:hypothetical protein DFH08DRAFT_895888 [Mycena albidolilacea]
MHPDPCPPTFPPRPSRAPPRPHRKSYAAAGAGSHARVQWAMSLPSPSPPLPVWVHPTPIPMAHGHSLKGEYSDGDVPRGQTRLQVCCRTTQTPPRNDIYLAADMGVANGSYLARMRTGVIREEKDEWGRHFPWRPTYGSTTISRSRMSSPPAFETHNTTAVRIMRSRLEPAQAFPPRLLVLIPVRVGIPASNGSR